MIDTASLLGQSRARAARGELHVHDHMCGIYDSHEEQYEPACRFLMAGLERNEQCGYIAESLTPVEFGLLLRAHGVDVAGLTASGALQIISGEQMRARLGGFTPAAMFEFLSLTERKALADGYTAFRWAADMTWLKKDGIQAADMFLYESQLNSLLAQHRLVGFCQYARDDFTAELLLAAAETHPLLVYNTTVCDNFYYVPPQEYLKADASEAKLTRYLYNIITRERLMQHFLSGQMPGPEDPPG